MNNKKIIIPALTCFLTVCLLSTPLFSQKKTDTSKLIYVPVYSSIYHGNQDRVINLAVTLSIRNVDMRNPVTIHSINYYNSNGSLIRAYLNTARVLKPLETMNIIIKESDTQGGNTSCFIVGWGGEKNVSELLVEAVMIGTYPQGISFTSRGINIKK